MTATNIDKFPGLLLNTALYNVSVGCLSGAITIRAIVWQPGSGGRADDEAVDAGGKHAMDPMDHGFMYGWSFYEGRTTRLAQFSRRRP